MQNINLKYLIIGVISLSILIVAGAVLFSLLQDYKKPPTPAQQTNNSIKPSPVAKPAVKNPEIRIVYPSGQATRSSIPLPKPVDLPRTIEASGSSVQISGPKPKNIPKP